MAIPSALERGRAALRAWSWEEARAAFEEALAGEESIEALEGLSSAAAWLDDIRTAISAQERAYRLHRARGDDPAAAAAAANIAQITMDFLGEPAVVTGWLERARRLLAGRLDEPILAYVDGLEAYLALAYMKDVPRARNLAQRAVRAAGRAGDFVTETMGQALLGLILVTEGRLQEGMRLLDQSAAAAVSGDLGSAEAAASTCCFLVTACVRVRDLPRAAEWSRQVMDISRDWTNKSMFSYPRTEYATALMLWGKWDDAERELRTVVTDMEARPVLASVALLRLAELRRRQGHLAEAGALLDQLEQVPYRSPIGITPLGIRSAIALDAGDPATAADLASRYLDAVPADDMVERVDALDVLVRARSSLGEVEGVAAAARELEAIAEAIPTKPFRATARFAAGHEGLAAGTSATVTAFLEALDLYRSSEMPLEAARARFELARGLLVAGHPQDARKEGERALAALVALGAGLEETRVARFLEGLGAAGRSAPHLPIGLTRRELEILRLLAQGLSNDQIAERLTLSVRTVERHVSNAYAKIGADGRSARAIATAYAHTHGIA